MTTAEKTLLCPAMALITLVHACPAYRSIASSETLMESCALSYPRAISCPVTFATVSGKVSKIESASTGAVQIPGIGGPVNRHLSSLRFSTVLVV